MWSQSSPSKRKELEEANERIAREISKILGKSVSRGSDGVWYIAGGQKLFDTYHTGGIAGNQPSLKQDEMMAKLKKGEPVLDKQRENTVYKLIDFATFVKDKLGAALAPGIDRSMFNISPQSLFAPSPAPIAPNKVQAAAFSPNIEINVNGVGDKVDGKNLAELISKTTIEKLKETFGQVNQSRSGIPIFSNS